MTCQSVQYSLSAHLDGYLPEEKKQRLLLHLACCEDCAQVSEQLLQLRRVLRQLPAFAPPEELAISLSVLASKERVRRLAQKTPAARLANWGQRARFWVDNMMRPMALPFAGGFISAVVLFSMLMPNILLHRTTEANDVPTGLSTEVTIKSLAPFGFNNDDDVVVEVMVDGQGRMVDYSIAAHGQSPGKDPKLSRSIGNNLLFTEFTPATSFGQPTNSKILVGFSRRQINVKS
jgi:hypothetical protein